MSANTLLSLSGAVTTVIIGCSSTYFSRRAAKLSEPTGNGFAAGLSERLDRQDAVLDRLDQNLTEHLRDHAFPRGSRADRLPYRVKDKDSA